MNDEIKEIDNSDLMELLETTSKKDFYRLTLDHELVVRLYNWITNLQKENERLNNIINELEKDLIDYFKKEYADRKLEDCNLENCTYDYALVMLGKLKKLKEGK